MAIQRTIFQDELRSILGKKGITYREFERISGVSKTYLTKILVHGLVPSKKIIESIAKSLNIMPEIFVEYKILKIIHRFEKIYKFIDEDNLNKINNILDGIEETLKRSYEISKLSGREQINFNPDYYLNINDLDENQRRASNILIEEFRRINVEKKIEFNKLQIDKNKEIIKSYNHTIQDFKKYKGVLATKRLQTDKEIIKSHNHVIQELKNKGVPPAVLQLFTSPPFGPSTSLSPGGEREFIELYRGKIEKLKKQNKLLEAELKNLKNEL